ncbi:RNA ligase family protein [Paenibacillus ginsengihumi]|uniref:ATP-dependent DNA ligase n=1 Tax=Paenibacillus ginsengihumi TaxID=431596 RepID=UPI00035D04C5|nr:RNA ligase family protein [Paenibacillus ginsengihumi]
MEPIIPFEPVSRTSVPEGEQWIHQVKWDGVRILTYYDGSEVRLFNRKRNERTVNYPELQDIRSYCSAESVILDGEMIALGANGKPSFHEVMKRDGIRRAERVKTAAKLVPVAYMVFDVLYYNGAWVTERTLKERNELLKSILKPERRVQLVPSFADGEALFRLMKEQGMEGIVSKNANSSYALNGKDERWVKVKNYGDLLAVIGGFTLNAGIVNAVLVGVYDRQGRLYYIGHVGTGRMARSEWAALTDKLKPLLIGVKPFVNDHPDMKKAYFVEPRFVVKVKYTEWRWKEGRTLRQPSIQAFVDADPADCVFDFT